MIILGVTLWSMTTVAGSFVPKHVSSPLIPSTVEIPHLTHIAILALRLAAQLGGRWRSILLLCRPDHHR